MKLDCNDRQCEEELGLSNSATNLHINAVRKSFHPKLKGKQSEKVISESTDEKENEKNISVLVKENSNEISELKKDNQTIKDQLQAEAVTTVIQNIGSEIRNQKSER